MTRLSRGWPVLSTKPSMNSGTMSSVAQPMCTSPCRVGVAHRDGIIDQHQLDFEFLALGRLPNFAGLEAFVGQDDRPPAGPHVEREPDRVVFQRLVGRSALHFRQALGRPEVYSLTVVTEAESAASAVWPSSPGSMSPPSGPRWTLPFRREHIAAIRGKRQQAADDQKQHQIKRSFRLSVHRSFPGYRSMPRNT